MTPDPSARSRRTHAPARRPPPDRRSGPVSTALSLAIVAVAAAHLATHPAVAAAVVGTVATLIAVVVVAVAALVAAFRVLAWLAGFVATLSRLSATRLERLRSRDGAER